VGLPWIQVDKAFLASIELSDLANTLKRSKFEALGMCNFFWVWSADAAADGTVTSPRRSQLVDESVGVAGFADAMVSAGLLDDDGDSFRIIGWDRYEKALKKQAHESRRKREWRARTVRGLSRDIDRDVRGKSKSQSKTEIKTTTPPTSPPPAAEGTESKSRRRRRKADVLYIPSPEKPERCSWWRQNDKPCPHPPSRLLGGREWLCESHASAYEAEVLGSKPGSAESSGAASSSGPKKRPAAAKRA